MFLSITGRKTAYTHGHSFRKEFFLKKGYTVATIISALFFLYSCASTGNGNGGISLHEAIEQSARQIAAELPVGSRVAVVAFASESSNLSEYIMEELTAELFARKIEVAARQNLEYVYRELNLQMSGDVDDNTAQNIGKFLGAELVITGNLRHLGSSYRFTANAVYVEKASLASIPRSNVRNDRDMQNMIKSLNRQTAMAQPSRFDISEHGTPQTAGAFLDRGIMFAARGDFAPAITDFTDALRLNPNLLTAYQLRGRALYASATNVTYIDENFSAVGTLTTVGEQASVEQMRTLERAINDFTQAIRHQSNNANLYRERGDAYSAKGDPDSGIADFNQAIVLDRNNTEAYNSRGLAYWQKGDYDRAIADYTQVIRIAPDSALAYNNRGLAYDNKGDYNRAITDYTQAIRIAPDSALAYNNRGISYVNKGDYDKAIADCTQAIRLYPDYAESYNVRGTAYYYKMDYSRALADFEAALQINPNHLIARSNFEDTMRLLQGGQQKPRRQLQSRY